MPHTLSKSNYIQYLDCPEELWLQKNKRELIPDLDEATMFKIEQGDFIDILAQKWFEEGAIINGISIPTTQASFQDRIEQDGFVIISDVLVRHEDNTVSIFEVKATTKVKSKHLHDVAFQRMVFEEAGYEVRKTYLVHVNKAYEAADRIDKQSYLIAEDITAAVLELLPATRIKAKQALEFINAEAPQAQLNPTCSKKENCPYLKYKLPDLPDYSVFNISRISKSKLKELTNQGIFSVQDVPKNYELSTRQRSQVSIAQQRSIQIDHTNIRLWLGRLNYPLYFLDYETYGHVDPPQRGYRPYQQMIVQFSLHILDAPNAELRHACYLLNDRQASVEHLLQHLSKFISMEGGSVIVWNESFEKRRNSEAATLYPAFAPLLHTINDRTADLKDVFGEGYYIHPAFKGSTSIKNVLPVFWKENKYNALEINNGSMATIAWHKMTDDSTSADDKAAIQQQLHDYCFLDTLAMVKIYEGLMKLEGA